MTGVAMKKEGRAHFLLLLSIEPRVPHRRVMRRVQPPSWAPPWSTTCVFLVSFFVGFSVFGFRHFDSLA